MIYKCGIKLNTYLSNIFHPNNYVRFGFQSVMDDRIVCIPDNEREHEKVNKFCKSPKIYTNQNDANQNNIIQISTIKKRFIKK